MSSKKLFLAASVIWITSLLGSAAALRDSATEKPVILERGPNHRIVRHISWQTNATGRITARTNTYTELATGMHYQENGAWKESKEQIELLPGNAGAVANQGPHKVMFPPDIYDGMIEVFTPDGQYLKSRPVGIGYYDGTNSVLLAELTPAVGLLLPSGQQVLYTNCFKGLAADLRYTYRKNGFEQDIILREQPPAPQQFGVNPRTARLEVITEFFDTADPVSSPVETVADAATGLADQTLAFGKLKMVRGKAFALDDASPMRARGERVYKSWERLEGRKFLVETVPLAGLASQLKRLPLTARASTPSSNSTRDVGRLAAVRQLPATRSARGPASPMLLAKAEVGDAPGLVVDYNTIIDSLPGDFTFQAGTTYYISGFLFSYGGSEVITIQGGSVLKYARGAGLDLFNSVVCDTTSENPAYLTAVDDDTVGEPITGYSTGTPSGTYAEAALAIETGFLSTPLQHLRIANANYGIAANADVRHCEFRHTTTAVASFWSAMKLENLLLFDVTTGFADFGSGAALEAAFVTAHQVGTLTTAPNLNVVNSLFINVASWGSAVPGAYNGSNPSDSGVFQSYGTATHYLTAGSTYRNQGTTTGIDTGLLAEIQTLTTYAPQDGGYPDTDTPDLGYHYPAANPDSDSDGLPDAWEMTHFGNLAQSENGDYDGDGVSNLDEFNAPSDPNTISFFPNFGNYYVNSTTAHGTIELETGVPSQIAVLINNDNFSSATWQTYNGPNFTFTLGPSDGVYTVHVGLRGRSTDAAQTWESETVTLDRVAPAVVITTATPATTSQPVLQLVGYSPEKLRTISFDVSNSSGLLANQEGNVTDQVIDPTTGQFTTNWFACRDIRLATGLNTITLRTTDMAGNMSTHTYNYTLDYSGDTTPPVLTLEWPQNGNNISGNSFTLRGSLDDSTATVSATITDSMGNSSTAAGIVERDGLLWVENLPLGAGANTLTLTIHDAAGNMSTSTITVNKSTVNLTIDPISDPTQLTATITGKINVNDHTVWVNGVIATLTDDGAGGWNWQADDVNMGTGGTAVIQATAIPNSDNGGNGSGGGGAGGTGAPGNPSSPNAPSAAQTPERAAFFYVQKYKLDYKQRLRWTGVDCYQCYSDGDDKWWSNLEWTSAYTLGPSGGSSGTYKNGYRYDVWWPDGTPELSCGETILTCPKDIYNMPNIGPTRTGPTTITSCSAPSSTGTGSLWAFPWEIWDEHQKDAWMDPQDGSSWMTDYDRTASMTVKLKTGGKSGSSKQNIFALSASALNYKRINTYTGQWETEAVPPTSIKVCGKTLWADSIVYKKLADNDDVDITPIAPPKRYRYTVNAVKYRMTPQVSCIAAADPNPERTSLGVGEHDTISGMPAETQWSTSGGTLSPPGPGPSSAKTLIAPGVGGNVTVTATVRDVSATIDFSIVEPSGVQVSVRGQDSYSPPFVGAGIYLDVYLTPKTVSFYRVQMMEPAAAATGKMGYFANPNTPPPNHDASTGADDWHPVNCENKVVEGAFDHAFSSGWPLGISGSYTWPISPIWRIGGTGPSKPLSGWTPQVHTVTSGTMKIDKLGHSVTRPQNQVWGTTQ